MCVDKYMKPILGKETLNSEITRGGEAFTSPEDRPPRSRFGDALSPSPATQTRSVAGKLGVNDAIERAAFWLSNIPAGRRTNPVVPFRCLGRYLVTVAGDGQRHCQLWFAISNQDKRDAWTRSRRRPTPSNPSIWSISPVSTKPNAARP
jgi:hypothetical protein